MQPAHRCFPLSLLMMKRTVPIYSATASTPAQVLQVEGVSTQKQAPQSKLWTSTMDAGGVRGMKIHSHNNDSVWQMKGDYFCTAF